MADTKRYVALEGSGHECCLSAHVEDTDRPDVIGGGQWVDSEGRAVFKTVCECYSLEEAQQIADALNAAVKE